MTRWMLGWVLDGSWVDFWWVLGPSWEVSWGQVGTKIRQNGVPKRCEKINKNLKPRWYATVRQAVGLLAP